jgi:hypothetical protein
VKRVGECPPERCQGRCCKEIGIWISGVGSEDFLELLRVRGVDVQEHGDLALVSIQQTCQHLTDKGLCGLYGKPERPKFCSDFPEEPSQLLRHTYCGFEWEYSEVAKVTS